jgi:hypothetical protein
VRRTEDPHNYSTDLFGGSEAGNSTKRGLELAEVAFPTFTKRRFARPTHISRIPKGTNIAAGIWGAQAMGKPLTPQGEEVCAVLNARRPDGRRAFTEVVVLIPRRSTKTTAIYAELIGRCATIPNYIVLITAQDATRAREVLRLTVMEDLKAAGFLSLGIASFRLANGSEAIEFYNGSIIKVVPPTPSKFRSKAADVIVVDEAGEIDPDLGASIVTAALPLMDTRPDSQLIVAGTPPETGESGFLWDELQEAIDPKMRTTGVVAYMLRSDESAIIYHDDGTLELDTKVIRRVHPGIGTVTTLATIRARFDKFVKKGQPAAFEREYGCRFVHDEAAAAFDFSKWVACSAGEGLPERPSRVGLAYDIEPDGSAAGLVAAWRDDENRPHFELLAFNEGSTWLTQVSLAAARKHRVPIAHDSIGVNTDVGQNLIRLRVQTSPVSMRDMIAAEARLAREVDTLKARHYSQPDVDDHVRNAVWRNIGDGGRLIGRRASSGRVCIVIAAACALWQYDNKIAKRPGVAGAVIRGGNQ